MKYLFPEERAYATVVAILRDLNQKVLFQRLFFLFISRKLPVSYLQRNVSFMTLTYRVIFRNLLEKVSIRISEAGQKQVVYSQQNGQDYLKGHRSNSQPKNQEQI